MAITILKWFKVRNIMMTFCFLKRYLNLLWVCGTLLFVISFPLKARDFTGILPLDVNVNQNLKNYRDNSPWSVYTPFYRKWIAIKSYQPYWWGDYAECIATVVNLSGSLTINPKIRPFVFVRHHSYYPSLKYTEDGGFGEYKVLYFKGTSFSTPNALLAGMNNTDRASIECKLSPEGLTMVYHDIFGVTHKQSKPWPP